MTTPVRAFASLAAVLVLAVGAYTVIQRPASGVAGAGSTPSVTPLATPAATYSVTAGPRGTSVVHAVNFDIPLSLTFTADWRIAAIDRSLVDLVLQNGTDMGIHSLAMVTLPGPTLTDQWIAVPADFVAWINQRPEFVASTPRSITIAGRTGTLIDADFVWTAGTAPRDFLRYGTGAWLYDKYDAGNRARFIVLPGSSGVGGLIIVMNARAAGFEADAASLDALLATLQFDPAS